MYCELFPRELFPLQSFSIVYFIMTNHSYPLNFTASFGVYCEKSYASSVKARLIIWNKKAENIIFMLRKVDNEHKTFDLQWLDAYDKCGKIMQYAI